MNHATDHMLEASKGIVMIVSSSAAYIANLATGALTNAPEWVQTLGFPVTVSGVLVLGLIKVWQELNKERAARIEDRKDDAKRWQDAYVTHAEAAQETRVHLVEVTTEQNLLIKSQTEANKELTDRIETALKP